MPVRADETQSFKSCFLTLDFWRKGQRNNLRRTKRCMELAELKGKRLGCFCHPQPCHGDVLAELADRED